MRGGQPKISFISLGLMGAKFTKKLTALGYQLIGYDSE
jgi:3-hydroxyisobutyrate dehydrogenase-like beta-hydroxyacid dehydrogenase